MKHKLTASTLRILLIVMLFLVIALAIGGFYFAQIKLTEYASSISQLNADADAGSGNVETLKRLQVYLERQKLVIKKTEAIVADSKSYAYQDQIVDDIVAIGKAADIKITGFTFETTGAATAPTTAPATAAPTTPAVVIPGGVKSTTANITVGSPANYDNVLDFIKRVERNPTKMQIKNVSMSKSGSNSVTAPTFAIEVYIR